MFSVFCNFDENIISDGVKKINRKQQTNNLKKILSSKKKLRIQIRIVKQFINKNAATRFIF